MCLFFHVGRGIYYQSYYLFHTWIVGERVAIPASFIKTDSQDQPDPAVHYSSAGSIPTVSFSNPNYGESPVAKTTDMAEQYREFDTSPIIPEIRIHTYSVRIREVILGLVAITAILGCLALIAVVATNKTSISDTPGKSSAQIAMQTLCTDPPCLKAAAYGVSYMNASINPCDDFFQYACGNYPTLNPLNPDVSQRSVFLDLYTNNQDNLRTLLQTSTSRTSAWSSERKVKDFYSSCMDDYGKMASGGKPLLDKVIQPIGGWDVIGTFNSSAFDFQTALEKTSIDFWTAALFTFRVLTDFNDPNTREIEVDAGGLGMYWPYYTRDTAQQVRDDYKKYIQTVGQLLARDSGLTFNASQLDNKIQTFVDDAYDIEAQLANITASTLPSGDPHNHENRMTIGELTAQTGNVIDFTRFFQHMFGATNVNRNTRVIVSEEGYIRQMCSMVAALPADVKARKISNYLVWKVARRYVSELSWNYIHANRQFYVDVTGRTNFYGIPNHCFWKTQDSMGDALGALFAKLHFSDKNKDKAEEIVKYVKDALIDSVSANTFLDESTRVKAVNKLKASTDKMGYPDIYLNDAAIDNIYQGILINRTDYFQNLLNLNAFIRLDWTRRLTSGEDKSRWLFNSFDTAMTFYNSWNQLLVPAGMLQFPIYEWTLPHYFNFGSMGGLMGHYLVHAIDDWGRFYNEHGVYGNWYTNQSVTSYTDAEACFARAFHNKTIGPITPPGRTVPVTFQTNGINFAWEGMASISGLRVAYKAYKKWIVDKGEEKLTPTPHYTNDQSFFLAYAQTYCNTKSDAIKYRSAASRQIPEELKTNIALSLLHEFSSTFGCPANSAMNAQEKCATF